MSDHFRVHKLNETGLSKARDMAQAFEDLVRTLDSLGVGYNPRYRALVLTKLEEACFFAKKAMASDPGFQSND